MKLFDISVGFSPDLPSWPGENGFTRVCQDNQDVKVSQLTLGTHTGTHVDAPCHFIPAGDDIDQVSLSTFLGEALVCHFLNRSSIGLQELMRINLDGVERILLRTSNSALWSQKQFCKNYVALELEAAKHLVNCGIKLVGIDYLSIEAFESIGNPVHKMLLGRGVIILEGLNLSAIEEGRYTLIALPLKILGADGSPVRAVLLQDGDKNLNSRGDSHAS